MRVPEANFAFCGGSYEAVSPTIDASRSINLYPESELPTSRARMALIGRPGLSPFITLPTSPVRSLWSGNARLFAAAGTNIYEVSSGGSVIQIFGGGLSPGITPIPMFANANAGQLLACDPAGGEIYNVNPVTGVLDPVFEGVALEWLDGFFVAIATGASLVAVSPNQINVSKSLDGTVWPGADYVLRTGSADLITQLSQLGGLLWIFGQQTIEVWYNAGNPNFPFARVNGGTINLGCVAPASVVKFQNSIFFLGGSSQGYPRVYQAKSLQPEPISNAGIENYIVRKSVGAIAQCTAYGYEEIGHQFYVLNLVDLFGNITPIAYDLTTGLWHERSYSGPTPICEASVQGFSSNSANFVGDALSGQIFYQSIEYPNDGDPVAYPITYRRQCPHLSDGNHRTPHTRFELAGDFGAAEPTLDWADGGLALGTLIFGGRERALRQADPPAGDLSPTFRRFYANQLGMSRDRVYQLNLTSGTDTIRIASAYLDIEPGDS